jgi:ribosomal protein L32E
VFSVSLLMFSIYEQHAKTSKRELRRQASDLFENVPKTERNPHGAWETARSHLEGNGSAAMTGFQIL